ncbi:MAG: glycosyltransferase [Desulfarculaceae bacterium]|nr:glycosyltransferase [Desulfarculaceae bacterium]MCF8073198.1 glycosyltransferase [Desulfarculaceae bacterium]MCF8100794.1 glycosyltransferase [Desulfarculaceae bacterium]MCF8118441.1 glycosyltransferase [Desulfarculaceae bacterium]
MFSFVLPCHNDVSLLMRTLAGLCLNRGGPEFEVFLADNNSFDEDIDAAYRKYVNHLELYLIRQPRLPHPRATSRARNLGMNLARGEWIINLDSDCVPLPGYLARLAAYLNKAGRQNPIVTGLRRFVDFGDFSDDDILRGRVDFDALPQVASPANYHKVTDRRLPYLQRLGDSEHPWAYFHTCNMIYRKSTALRIGGFDEVFDGVWGYEDIDFAHRMMTVGGAEPRYLPGIECLHQDSRSSHALDRFNKRNNPNWHRIIKRIPGFEQFKSQQYRTQSREIRL